METQLFQINRPVSTTWQPGRLIKVTGISDATPVPSHVTEAADPYSGPVFGTPLEVDAFAHAAELRACFEIWNAPRIPDLTRAELRTRLGVDDAIIDEMVTRLNFPKPRPVQRKMSNDVLERVIDIYEAFDGKTAGEWFAFLEKIRPALDRYAKRRG